MTEHIPPIDPFDKIMNELEGDAVFQGIVEELNDREAISRIPPDADIPSIEVYAYYKESLNAIAAKIYSRFQQICKEYGVDVNAPNPSPEKYRKISESLALELYSMKKELWAGDRLWATNAFVLDPRTGVDDAIGVVSIGNGEAITGRFASPVVGPMPDEFTMLTLGEIGNPPMGVGLAIEDVAIVDENGELHRGVFESPHVVVALGNAGLDLQKLCYDAKQ